MKIERITLSNFRCFGGSDVIIAIDRHVTALVGNNGSGKTAVLSALGKMFGTSVAQRSIRKSDFHVPSTETQIESGATLVIDCVLGFPELAEGGEDEAVPEVFRHMSVSGEDDPLQIRVQLRAKWTDNGTPDGVVEDELRWIGTLDEDFKWDDCKRVSAIERGFIQLVYVPASRNAADQVTSLLKGRLWRAAKWSKGFREQVAIGATALQELFEKEAPAAYIAKRLNKRWAQVHQGDTDTKPILRLLEGRFDDLVKRAEFGFFPDEARQIRSLDNLSDGQRSLFHIALTAATLEIERDALAEKAEDCVFDQDGLRRTYLTILAIEEPENSLSPFFLSRIMTQAREIGAMESAQVIVSSHSASILSRVEPEEVRYMRMDEKSRASIVRPLDLPKKLDEAHAYVRLAVRAYPELYFARYVILAEGESESIVLPRIAEAMDFPIDRSFVPIVPLGGRFVHHFWRLLSGLGIPYVTLLDLDTGRAGGGKGRIQYAVDELAAVGNDLSDNVFVLFDDIDIDEIHVIDEAELVEEDYNHAWLKALRREGVYFSSPLDLDFSMAAIFSEYRKARPGGTGPRGDIAEKKQATLKAGGDGTLYDSTWDDTFRWYPYHFIGSSKPEAHLAALATIDNESLAVRAPAELKLLLAEVKKAITDGD